MHCIFCEFRLFIEQRLLTLFIEKLSKTLFDHRSVMLLFVSLLILSLTCWQVSATTIVAARCSNGIVLAADSQSVSANTKVVISSRTVKKVFQLSKSTILCTASSLPKGDTDFQQLYNALRDTIATHEHHFESTLSSSAIAKVTRQLINTKFNSAHVVVAGWDEQASADNTDTCSYVLCEILPGGSKIDAPLVVAGSGATLIASLLEDSLVPSARDVSASVESLDSPKLPVSVSSPLTTHLTTQQTIPILQRSLKLASKLDPHTGGDKYHMCVLTKPNNKFGGANNMHVLNGGVGNVVDSAAIDGA